MARTEAENALHRGADPILHHVHFDEWKSRSINY